MHLGWFVTIISSSFCVQLSFAVLHSHPKFSGTETDTQNGIRHSDDITRRSKREFGFWYLFNNRYRHTENYFSVVDDIPSSALIFRLLVNRLLNRGLNYDILSDEAQVYRDDSLKKHHDVLSRDYFQDFQPYDKMVQFMEEATHRCQRRCSLFTIGNSYEGRPLIGIKIGTSKHDKRAERRSIWIDGGTHAREWITHTTALFLADMLIGGYSQDRFIRHLVHSYDWYIMPCLNPDGYNYTWTNNRLWRKTRRPNPNTNCSGTDLNRNYGFKWGHGGASSNPCRSNYRGPRAYSEPEAKALVEFIQSEHRNDTWLMFITLHSQGQLIMSPWGYTSNKPNRYKQMERVGQAVAKAMTEKHNMQYVFGQAARILYRSSGTSRDWAYGKAGIPYVYTFELRDKNNNGWLIDPSNIIPAGEEVWEGLKESIRTIEQVEMESEILQ